MALHYILDGYNIIKSMDALADLSLEQGRNALLKIIHIDRPQGSARNQVTVVFDGKEDVWGHQPGGIAKVVFTSGGSADDCIKNMVEEAQERRNISVVTNDGAIAFYIRKLGARAVSVQEFLSSSSNGKKVPYQRTRGRGKDSGKGSGRKAIARVTEYKINKEFEKIWLERKSKNRDDAP